MPKTYSEAQMNELGSAFDRLAFLLMYKYALREQTEKAVINPSLERIRAFEERASEETSYDERALVSLVTVQLRESVERSGANLDESSDVMLDSICALQIMQDARDTLEGFRHIDGVAGFLDERVYVQYPALRPDTEKPATE